MRWCFTCFLFFAEVAIEEYLVTSGHMSRDDIVSAQRSKGRIAQAEKKKVQAQAAATRKRKRGMQKITNAHLINKPEFAWLSTAAVNAVPKS